MSQVTLNRYYLTHFHQELLHSSLQHALNHRNYIVFVVPLDDDLLEGHEQHLFKNKENACVNKSSLPVRSGVNFPEPVFRSTPKLSTEELCSVHPRNKNSDSLSLIDFND